VFLLDDGIDTGPILAQERVLIPSGRDSHLTLAWKGMIQLAELQAHVIRRLDAGECLPPPKLSATSPRILTSGRRR
jgi:methionyl-tRNA formyltransferase